MKGMDGEHDNIEVERKERKVSEVLKRGKFEMNSTLNHYNEMK